MLHFMLRAMAGLWRRLVGRKRDGLEETLLTEEEEVEAGV
jgi:hypothetical protein